MIKLFWILIPYLSTTDLTVQESSDFNLNPRWVWRAYDVNWMGMRLTVKHKPIRYRYKTH